MKGSIVVLITALICLLSGLADGAHRPVYDVVKFGAVGNGRRDDSKHFLRAWSAACIDSRSTVILIPRGRTFLLNQQVTFSGPCRSSIHVQVLGNLVAPSKPWKMPVMGNWITFIHTDNLTIDGNGVLDGRGGPWWDCKLKGKCYYVPDALAVLDCRNFRLAGLKLLNSPAKHFTVHESQAVHISGLRITAPGDSPNTDGILISESQQVEISDSDIGTGDDCIALVGGSSDVNITRINCGPGHGISIGSLGQNSARDDVQNVRVSNCNFYNTSNAARIKTWQGGSGHAKGITFEHLNLTSVRYPIVIDQYYCPERKNCKILDSAVQVSDVRFDGIQGTSTRNTAITLDCSTAHPCRDIFMRNVNIRSETRGEKVVSRCSNAYGRAEGLVYPKVPCFRF